MVDMNPRTDTFKMKKLNELYESKLRIAAWIRHKKAETGSKTGSTEGLNNEAIIVNMIFKDLQAQPYNMTEDDIQNELLIIHEQRRSKK